LPTLIGLPTLFRDLGIFVLRYLKKMQKLLIFFVLTLLSVMLISQPGFEWAQACGHPFYGETNSVLEADAEGNIFMAGSFVDEAAFGAFYAVSTGGTDVFIAKHNASGEALWLISDGGDDFDYLHGLSVDEEGFYTCGSFYGTSRLGSNTFISLGSKDILLARYDLQGNLIWAKQVGSPKTDYVNAITTDPSGNMFISGYYYDSIAFGDTTIYSRGASDIFLAKYDVDGNLIWLTQDGGSSSDQSYTLSCDSEGNLVYTGSFFYDILVGDSLISTSDPTGVFMAKYDNDGRLIFARQVDGNGLLARSFASFDKEDNIYFAGNFTDQVNFGPYNFDAGAFNIDLFITRYDHDGQLLWADHGHSAGSDPLISISSGPLNDLYISGHFLDTIHFSDLTLKYTLCCGSAEIFMVRYTEDGTPAWGDQISGERALTESMIKNNADELFVSGMFQGELTFGGIMIESGSDYNNFLSGVATETMTSIPDQGIYSEIKIYPNPAGGHINITATDQNSKLDYSLMNMMGQTIMSGSFIGHSKIDLGNITAGNYVLRTSDYEKRITVSEMIVIW